MNKVEDRKTESVARVRKAHEIADVFEAARVDFDDEESESENEDHIETASAHESEEDVESGDEQVENGEGGICGEEEEEEEGAGGKRRRTSVDNESYWFSKSGFIWKKNADSAVESFRSDRNACPKADALFVTKPLESWSVLFTDEILNIIVTRTNEEIERRVASIKKQGQGMSTHGKHPLDLVELKGLIGLLYFSGLHKVNNKPTIHLWSLFGISLFRLTMTLKRFQFLLVVLRFDSKETRVARKKTDRLAKIREIWEIFIDNCKKNYEPQTNCTIDEQLLAFRGKCSFKMYVPGKPLKYGLQIFTINDAATHYLFNAIPYVGTPPNDENESIPSYYVRKLSEPIYYTDRTITCNNWFMSVPICDRMKKHYNLKMVGTIRKDHHEIPHLLKKPPPPGTNVQFAYHEGKTLVAYNPKAKKIVFLLSSAHQQGKIEESSGKPEILLFYDKTKSGSDGFDKKCHDYSTARKTARWTMRFFYGMLDHANVNSLILYSLSESNEKTTRYDFILDLSIALIQPLLSRRLTTSTLRLSLRVQIEAFLKHKNNHQKDEDALDSSSLSADNKMDSQRRCRICPQPTDKKTSYKCLMCDRPMCKMHVAKICCECSYGAQ